MTRTFPLSQPGDDDCPTCGTENYDGRRCHECGAMDEALLHDKVKRDLWAMRPVAAALPPYRAEPVSRLGADARLTLSRRRA